MSIRSGGDAARSLRAEAVFDRERDLDSLRRFRLASRDLDRFLDLSLSLDRDLDRLRFLLCLLLFECLDRDELRLRERPMIMMSCSGVCPADDGCKKIWTLSKPSSCEPTTYTNRSHEPAKTGLFSGKTHLKLFLILS